MADRHEQAVAAALDRFAIELPSWAFAQTGTRFGKFLQDAAASTLEEKLADAGKCHELTGACPSLAVNSIWDFSSEQSPEQVAALAEQHGVRIGAINVNVFQDQCYKLGSLGNPDPDVRELALKHHLDSITTGQAAGSDALSLWYGDGTNYPGQDNLRRRKKAFEDALRTVHENMPESMHMLVEYKPFEPAFYHTDIADWGMAYLFAKHAGPRASVLVDTGHHLHGTNIEHIVTILLDENMLGGFHFNDRKYADDDLTLGSIDPYAVFRIFNAIMQHEFDTGETVNISYTIDQAHNLKPKIEAMLQTVDRAQQLYAKAQLVDRKKQAHAQAHGDIVTAEQCLIDAYETDVRPAIAQWRQHKGLPTNPLEAYRASGHHDKIARERKLAREARGEVATSSFA